MVLVVPEDEADSSYSKFESLGENAIEIGKVMNEAGIILRGGDIDDEN